MKEVTFVIVSYQTPEHLQKAVLSICFFYPIAEIIVVDGSPVESDCYKYANFLKHHHPNCSDSILMKSNIGHGRGMDIGFQMAKTEFVCVMDSDAEIVAGGVIEKMMNYMKSFKTMYGIGQVVQVNERGENVEAGIDYLHPHFALIRRSHYLQLPGFRNEGAPCLQAMTRLVHSDELFVKNFTWHS